MSEPEIKVVSIPMMDTGIGKSMGYEDDKVFIEAARAERERLSPEVREVLDKFDADLERMVLFGDGSSAS